MNCDRCGNKMQHMFASFDPVTFVMQEEFLCNTCWALLIASTIADNTVYMWFDWRPSVTGE